VDRTDTGIPSLKLLLPATQLVSRAKHWRECVQPRKIIRRNYTGQLGLEEYLAPLRSETIGRSFLRIPLRRVLRSSVAQATCDRPAMGSP
jgi:hypothetical protein